MRLLILLPLFLASCVVMHERDMDGSTRTFAALGGKGAYDRSKGVAYDNEKSFAHAMTASTTVAGGYFYLEAQKAKEATSQLAARATTRQAGIASKERIIINGQNNQLKLAELEAAAAQ